MRHNRSYRKLGRVSEHRKALFRNQIRSLIAHERIITTLPKAKELKPLVEKIVTLGRQAESVHARRLVAEVVTDRTLVKRLFTEIGPRFVSRPGGYTRIVKLGPRAGDGAELAILEFVDFKLGEGKSKAGGESKKEKKRNKPPEAGAEASGPK
jgi:large subunit ribosomal protein L17